MSSKQYIGNNCLGILKEEKGKWERRAPLTPIQVHDLIKSCDGCNVYVQPCSRRIFSNQEYSEAGAIISDDLSNASLILGVKNTSPGRLLPNKSYMFFSHVIKGQMENMSLLDEMIAKNVRLFDYECITEDGKDDSPRLVAFGKFAGYAGMIDCLHGLGLKLLSHGYSTPYLNIPYAYMHQSRTQSIQYLTNLSNQLAQHPHKAFPASKLPLVFAFTGSGNVSQGAKEVFQRFPHQFISVETLSTLHKDIQDGKLDPFLLYGVDVTAKDMVRKKNSASNEIFDKKEYYRYPERYEPIFHKSILPYITVLVNGMYWSSQYPRLVTKNQINTLSQLNKPSHLKFQMVADITCDINGSVEFLSKPSSIDQPFYSYHPDTEEIISNPELFTRDGIMMMGIDNLPTELPREASEYFGSALLPLISPLLITSGSANQEDMNDLPNELTRACILSHSNLMPKWSYITRLRQKLGAPSNPIMKSGEQSRSLVHSSKMSKVGSHQQTIATLDITGHLFDTGLINRMLDLLEIEANELKNDSNSTQELHFSIPKCDIHPNTAVGPVHSHITLQITGLDPITETNALTNKSDSNLKVDVNQTSEASSSSRRQVDGAVANTVQHKIYHIIDQLESFVVNHATAEGRVHIKNIKTTTIPSPTTILLFGSGRVCKPIIKYFDKSLGDNVRIIVATDDKMQALDLLSCLSSDPNGKQPSGTSRGMFYEYRYPQDNDKLCDLIGSCDVILSMLPATMHVPIAIEAIKQKKHMVTASYVSPEMKKLHDEAKKNGVILLNEVGLDPGIDHMLVMNIVDSIHTRGGVVTELVSLCGGLPDPIAAVDNPFRYKISWSPKGVLNATRNPACYLKNNEIISIEGDQLLLHGQPTTRFPTLRLEVIPNRDSLSYRSLYGVPQVHTICRGTLRFEGWSNAMHSLSVLGLTSNDEIRFKINENTNEKFSLNSLDLPVLLNALSVYVAERINRLSMDPIHGEAATETNLQKYLKYHKVIDVSGSIEALKWLGVLETPLTDDGLEANQDVQTVPIIDVLSFVMEKKMFFKSTEKDMVAMFHTIVGQLPDGTEERHTSRLLTFGSGLDNGDTAMAATVGYTAAAAVEWLLLKKDSTNIEGGVHIPIIAPIYDWILERIQTCGINWSDEIEISHPLKSTPFK